MKMMRAFQVLNQRVVLLVLVGLLLTTAGVAAGADDQFIQKPEDDRAIMAVEPFAVLNAGGATLRFSEIRLPDGRVGGVAIAENVRAGYRGIGAVERLRGTDALEVYNALSAPGTRLPSQLVKLYGKPALGAQGWALPLPLVDAGDPQALSCMVGSEPFGVIEDEVQDFGYPFMFLSEADGPATMPNHWWDDNGPADGTIRRKLQGGVSSVEYFFGKVSYCFEDHDEYPLDFHGRYATFEYKVSGFGDWSVGASEQLMEPGDNVSYQFSIAPGVDWDFSFRLRIRAARPADQFHIGATWADPDETLVLED